MQDSLALGVIFAATDSVAVLQVLRPDRAPLLYSLVFGEGVINDATAVALLRAVQVCSFCSHLSSPPYMTQSPLTTASVRAAHCYWMRCALRQSWPAVQPMAATECRCLRGTISISSMHAYAHQMVRLFRSWAPRMRTACMEAWW